MEFPAASVAQLKEFGLSTYAARGYLALLELAVAEARGVSELAHIPTAKVYGTLDQLQRRGLAKVSPGKPRTYAPVPIEEFIERQLREQEEQSLGLRARKDQLVEMFPVVGTATLAHRAVTVTITGKRNIVQHLRDACAGVHESILAVMSPSLRADAAIERLLAQASARGVEVHILDDASPDDLDLLAQALPSGRFAPDAPDEHLIATFDDKAAMLVTLGAARTRTGRVDGSAIHTSETAYVQPLRRLLALQFALRRRVDADLHDPGRLEVHVAER